MPTTQSLGADKQTQPGIERRIDAGIAYLLLDLPDSKLNKLTGAVMTELERQLEALRTDTSVQAIVIASAKPDSFVAGADIDEIEALQTVAEATAAARFGQRVFAAIESMPKPVVAAVHGVCLGGGCEMVLACHHRVLSDDPATRIGLPEVKLGILPGFGGTQRLPRVVGLQAALDLILTGKTLDARRALRIGLADELAYPALLLEVATAAARRLVARGRWSAARASRRAAASVPGFLDRSPLGQGLVLRAARQKVRAETRRHYPAPLAAIESVAAGLRSGGRAYEREAELLGELAMTPVSKNLIGIFRLGEENKKLGADLPRAIKVRQIGVLGAGVMGGGIAHQAASHDVRVRLKDVAPEPLLAAFRTARDLFASQVARGRLEPRAMDAKMAHITATLDDTGFQLCDVVIEAVVENLDIKRKVLAGLEGGVRPDTVLASNTSSLSITALADGMKHPERVLGMHFFNPVHRMPLVEIVVTPHTDPQAVSRTLGLARQMGKTPVLVHDGPGFLVNRILAPYLNESGWLFEAGIDVIGLDRAMRRFGMPMGPFELLDEIGADVAHKVGDVLHAGLGDVARPSSLAGKLHEAGRLGKKTGRGMYLYRGRRGRDRRPDPEFWRRLRPGVPSGATPRDDEALDRIFGLMLNEAARCLDAGIVESAGEIDLALVYGIGFPPFRGGLLKYADERGLPAWVDRLRELEARLGPRFAPTDRLVRMAAAGERFFPDPRSVARG